MQVEQLIALDDVSVRTYDADGRLHVALTNISKANICPYFGREIPNAKELGLDESKVYYLLRDPDELKKAADTFNGVPLLFRHKPTDARNHAADITIGATGNDTKFEAPYLQTSLVIWPDHAIDAVESGQKRQLSCGYRYTADMTPGTYDGKRYDGVMRNIVGNHVALVAEGRAGPDVVVGDEMLRRITSMTDKIKSMSRRAAVTLGAIVGFVAPKLAADSKLDLSAVLADVTTKNFKEKKGDIVKAVTEQTNGKLAKDQSIEGVAALLDSLEPVEIAEDDSPSVTAPNASVPLKKVGEPDAGDKKKARDEKRKALDAWVKDKMGAKDCETYDAMRKGLDEDPDDMDPDKNCQDKKKKSAKDAEPDLKPDDNDAEDKKKKAMDEALAKVAADTEASVVKRMTAIRDAERAVRPYVGDIAVACDSADKVYEAAFKALKVDVAGIHPSAYPAILKMQPVPGKPKKVIAQDSTPSSDGFAKRFPDAMKIQIGA